MALFFAVCQHAVAFFLLFVYLDWVLISIKMLFSIFLLTLFVFFVLSYWPFAKYDASTLVFSSCFLLFFFFSKCSFLLFGFVSLFVLFLLCLFVVCRSSFSVVAGFCFWCLSAFEFRCKKNNRQVQTLTLLFVFFASQVSFWFKFLPSRWVVKTCKKKQHVTYCLHMHRKQHAKQKKNVVDFFFV